MTTFVINETQTHYTIKDEDDPLGKYTQCFTCTKFEVKYDVGIKLDCQEKHIPTLPACEYRVASGLTLRVIK
jgi:hypothetical protein